jgi:hypothetical protein
MSKCLKCNKQVPKGRGPVCQKCVDKLGLCPTCRKDTEFKVRQFTYCETCGKRVRDITPKPSKYLTIEFPKMMYTGKGRVSINGVPYKVASVHYFKKVRDERTGLVTNNNMQIKTIGRKRMVKHKLILINMNPSIGNKNKSYRVHAIKLGVLPVEHEVCEKKRRSSRRRIQA